MRPPTYSDQTRYCDPDGSHDENCFGSTAPWVCDECGPVWSAPSFFQMRRTDWNLGYLGCPICGSTSCRINSAKFPAIRAIKRRVTHKGEIQ